MKLGIFLLTIGLLFAEIRGTQRYLADYDYTKEIETHWTLADRASTLEQKSEYITKYVEALESYNLQGINTALILETPQESFDENIKAVKSLQNRLIEISSMDKSSFEYQTALQQITAQEQGQAHEMITELYFCWLKKEHYSLWNPVIAALFLLIQIVLIGGGIITMIKHSS